MTDMHPIERFGLISLILLTGCVTAIALYDAKDEDPNQEAIEAPTPSVAERAAADEREQLALRQENERREKAARVAREALAAAEVKATTERTGRERQERTEKAARRWTETTPANLETERKRSGLPRREVRDPEADLAARELQARRTLPVSVGEAPLGLGSQPEAASKPAPRQRAETNPKQGQTREYVVAKGDVLGLISQRELGSTRHINLIEQLNPKLDANHIRQGQVILLPLEVPEAKASKPAAVATKSDPAPATGDYQVADGESLWGIAQSQLGNGGLWEQIAALNPKIDPDRLEPGTWLVLPNVTALAKETPQVGLAKQGSDSATFVSKVR